MSSNPIDIGRRNLLKGRLSEGAGIEIRPPWSIGPGFESRCNRCGDCLAECGEGILVSGDGAYPRVDFNRGQCTFCAECVKVCKPGALDRAVGAPWQIKAEISTACLSQKGISCRSCGDVCDPRAISFRPQTGGRVAIQIEIGFCTGCGACLAVCPVHAVLMSDKQMRRPEGLLEGAA